jgi:hypothetical protein
VTRAERWSFIEARELEASARAALGEFLPDAGAEGLDIEAEARDARLVEDDEQFDRVVEEAGDRGDAWRRISWYEQLADVARSDRDMALLKSATRSMKLVAEQEFHRRAAREMMPEE